MLQLTEVILVYPSYDLTMRAKAIVEVGTCYVLPCPGMKLLRREGYTVVQTHEPGLLVKETPEEILVML